MTAMKRRTSLEHTGARRYRWHAQRLLLPSGRRRMGRCPSPLNDTRRFARRPSELVHILMSTCYQRTPTLAIFSYRLRLHSKREIEKLVNGQQG